MKASPLDIHHSQGATPFRPGVTTWFATFRLAGSMPAHVLQEIQEQRHASREFVAGIHEPARRAATGAEEELTCLEMFDRHLMRHHAGPNWLKEAPVAETVSDILRQKDKTEYDLLLYCIMPNHLHLVIDTGCVHEENGDPRKALSAVKRRTAHEANAILQRTGAFWELDHPEYCVGNADAFLRILWDVLFDPVRSDLCSRWHDWPWSYCRPGLVVKGVS